MMCANYRNLEQEVRSLDESGIDSFHIDIMDGRYVPNFAMSLNDMKCIRSLTDKPLDVHLMIEHPNNSVKLFTDNLRKGDTVYISKYKYVWKYQTDTVIQYKDSIVYIEKESSEVKEVKYVPAIYKWALGILIALIVSVVCYAAIKVYLKFKL